MTVKELSKLYWLNREVEGNQKELLRLEAETLKVEEELLALRRDIDGLASPNMDGMPHGTDVGSAVEARALRIMQLEDAVRRKHDALVNLRARISTKQTLVILERDRLEQYVGEIVDPFMRQIMRLRFVNGLSWDQVAACLGNTKGESVKKRCYRYAREH